MRFELSEEEQSLAHLMRDYARGEVAPVAPVAWAERRCPTELLRGMGKLDLMGLLVPEEQGGIGMTTVGFVAAMEELGAVDQSVAAAWQAHSTIGSLPLLEFGTPEQQQKWLVPLAQGETLGGGPDGHRVSSAAGSVG